VFGVVPLPFPIPKGLNLSAHGVARNELPWEKGEEFHNPERVE
jgi:hypothetical protein